MAKALNAVLSQPWAVIPDHLGLICQIAQRNLSAPELIKAREDKRLENTYQSTTRGNVAIIPVIGTIMPRASMFSMISGATSLEILAKDLQAAVDNPEIAEIVLEIDSPGGVAFGVSEFARMVRKANAQKPVTAWVGGYAASAAYWIATAAGRVVMADSSMVGSIGVVVASYVQEAADQDGYREFVITSSNAENKRPDPRTDEGRGAIMDELNQLESLFVSDVAAYRGVSVETVLAEFGRGACFVAADAVARGMADEVMDFEDLIADLTGAPGQATVGRPAGTNGTAVISQPNHSASGETSMSDKTKAAPAAEPKATGGEIMTSAQVWDANKEAAQAIYDEGFESGVDQGRTVGADAERDRILAIQAHGAKFPGHSALIAEMIDDRSVTADAAAGKILAAEAAKREARVDAFAEAEKSIPDLGAAASEVGGKEPAKAPAADAPIEDQAKAEWDADEALRAEYKSAGGFDSYLAFRKAEARGLARIKRG